MEPVSITESVYEAKGNDKIWSMLSHLSMLFGLGILLPLVVFLLAAFIAIGLYMEMPRVVFESQRNREQALIDRDRRLLFVGCRNRLLAVVDAYDAMTSERPYRLGRDRESACAEIARLAGTQFDPEMAHAFVQLHRLAG